jgi:hypothetical protein
VQGIIITKLLQCDKHCVRLYEVQKKSPTFILNHAQTRELATPCRACENVTDWSKWINKISFPIEECNIRVLNYIKYCIFFIFQEEMRLYYVCTNSHCAHRWTEWMCVVWICVPCFEDKGPWVLFIIQTALEWRQESSFRKDENYCIWAKCEGLCQRCITARPSTATATTATAAAATATNNNKNRREVSSRLVQLPYYDIYCI